MEFPKFDTAEDENLLKEALQNLRLARQNHDGIAAHLVITLLDGDEEKLRQIGTTREELEGIQEAEETVEAFRMLEEARKTRGLYYIRKVLSALHRGIVTRDDLKITLEEETAFRKIHEMDRIVHFVRLSWEQPENLSLEVAARVKEYLLREGIPFEKVGLKGSNAFDLLEDRIRAAKKRSG